jgi:hypothetical protein
VEKKLARLGVKVNWSKLCGTAYEDNPKLLFDEYLLVKNALAKWSEARLLNNPNAPAKG